MFSLFFILSSSDMPLRTRPPPTPTATFNRIPVIATGSLLLPAALVSGIAASVFFLRSHKNSGQKVLQEKDFGVEPDDQKDNDSINEPLLKESANETGGSSTRKRKRVAGGSHIMVKVTKKLQKSSDGSLVQSAVFRSRVYEPKDSILIDKGDKKQVTVTKIDDDQYEEDYYSYEEEYYEYETESTTPVAKITVDL